MLNNSARTCGRSLWHSRRQIGTMADRVLGTKSSIWVEFTALAAEHKAVNIGQGFPDSPVPKHITDFLKEISSHPEATQSHQYTRGFGQPDLVKNLARIYSDVLGVSVNPMSEVLVTVGAYLALYYAIQGWINPGDQVIIIEPAYDCYSPQVKMAGGVPVSVPLRLQPSADGEQSSSADLKLDMDELASKFSSKTKMLILNNPHNPTGKLFTRAELEAIAALAEKHDVLVIADEVYEWQVYPGHEMIRFASLPGMHQRTITIGSAGKTFSVTGWKLGWAIAPERLLWPLKCVHQNCVFTCSTPTQEAVARAYDYELNVLKSAPEKSYLKTLMVNELLPKREYMANFLRKAGFKPIIPEAGYFMMADFSALDGPFRQEDSTEDPLDYRFVRWLCKEKKLAGIPPSAFYCDENKHMGVNFVRFCFYKKDETLAAAEKILQDWIKK